MPFILDDTDRLTPIAKRPRNINTVNIPSAAAQAERGWLKNADGYYLHFSGDGIATEKAWRWVGTTAQAKALRRAHPFARVFRTLVPASV